MAPASPERRERPGPCPATEVVAEPVGTVTGGSRVCAPLLPSTREVRATEPQPRSKVELPDPRLPPRSPTPDFLRPPGPAPGTDPPSSPAVLAPTRCALVPASSPGSPGGPGQPGDGPWEQCGLPALCSLPRPKHREAVRSPVRDGCRPASASESGGRREQLQEVAPCGPAGLPAAAPPRRSPGPCSGGGEGARSPGWATGGDVPPTAPLRLCGLPVRVRAWPGPRAHGYRRRGAPPAPAQPRPPPGR